LSLAALADGQDIFGDAQNFMARAVFHSALAQIVASNPKVQPVMPGHARAPWHGVCYSFC
jgi:hypothetical protein